MLPFKVVYSDAYFLPIGKHVFPAEKYRRVRDRLIGTGVAESSDFLEPQPATDQDILLVHKPEYVQKLKKWRWRFPTPATWSTPSGWPQVDRSWLLSKRYRTESASASAEDFITRMPIMARASA